MRKLVAINLVLLGVAVSAVASQPISDYFASNTMIAQKFVTAAFNTVDCLKAAGTMLAVDYVAGGSVSLTDSVYNLSVTLVNVTTGETVKAASYQAVNDLANLTDAGVRAVA